MLFRLIPELISLRILGESPCGGSSSGTGTRWHLVPRRSPFVKSTTEVALWGGGGEEVVGTRCCNLRSDHFINEFRAETRLATKYAVLRAFNVPAHPEALVVCQGRWSCECKAARHFGDIRDASREHGGNVLCVGPLAPPSRPSLRLGMTVTGAEVPVS